MNKDSILNDFGKNYIRETRDGSIKRIRGYAAGEYNTEEAKVVESFFQSLSDEQKRDFDKIVLLTVDSVIFRVLRLAEQDVLKIGYRDIENISEVSDGLSGEIFGENGWIRSFSDFPPSMK